MAGRVDKIEFERRIGIVYDFIVLGGDTPRIIANIAQLFGIKKRQAQTYINQATERLRSVQQTKLGNKYGEIAEVFREVRRRRRGGTFSYFRCPAHLPVQYQ